MKVLLYFLALSATISFAERRISTFKFTTTEASNVPSTVAEAEKKIATEAPDCGENSTLCTNSTDYPNVTAVLPRNETLIRNVQFSAIKDQNNFCTCDLQGGFCDVNCCCDKDCSSEDKQVFEYCQSEPRFYDARYCDYMKYIYINNTPVMWHMNSNGLFCIIKSNHPPSYVVQRKHLFKTFAESQLEKINGFSWRKETIDNNDNFNLKKLIVGSSMWVASKRGVHKFGILNKFVTNRCLIKESIFYLKNLNTACSQVEIHEDNPYINLKYYFENVYLISNPTIVNISTWKQKSFENCPRNVCLSIVPKICDESFNKCENIKKDSTTTVRCNLTIATKINTCYNVVKKLRYHIYHNGTKGIDSVVALAVLDTVTYEFGEAENEVDQEFSVGFIWRNNASDIIEEYSGNPGYLTGKPILTGKLFKVINGTAKVSRNNAAKHRQSFLVVPQNVEGDCALNGTHFTTVEFGYNLLTKCRFSTVIFGKEKNVNATEMCRGVQMSIFNVWNIENDTLIGSFGNARKKYLDDWQKILYKNDPSTVLNNTFGFFPAKTSAAVFCFNIITELEINIFHAKIDVDTLLNQEKILGTTFSFGGYANRTLYFRKNSSSVYFESTLKTVVTFRDVTDKKGKKSVDPPKLDIKLPYDFFYPFVRINNRCSFIELEIFTIVAFLVVALSVQ